MDFNRGIKEFSGDDTLRKKFASIYRVEPKEFQKKTLVRDFAIRNLRDSQNILSLSPLLSSSLSCYFISFGSQRLVSFLLFYFSFGHTHIMKDQ